MVVIKGHTVSWCPPVVDINIDDAIFSHTQKRTGDPGLRRKASNAKRHNLFPPGFHVRKVESPPREDPILQTDKPDDGVVTG
jgi:hypothetical protein